MNVIALEQLCLVPLIQAYARRMFDVLSDPAIYEFENAPPVSIEWLEARYLRLERRGSLDGREVWLNWVIELPSQELAGYVQATVFQDGLALIAYELGSIYWRRGIGSTAVRAMLTELRAHYRVHTALAVLKTANFRSMALLQSLNFTKANVELTRLYQDEADESVMVLPLT